MRQAWKNCFNRISLGNGAVVCAHVYLREFRRTNSRWKVGQMQRQQHHESSELVALQNQWVKLEAHSVAGELYGHILAESLRNATRCLRQKRRPVASADPRASRMVRNRTCLIDTDIICHKRKSPNYNFDNIGMAMVTLFELLSLEGFSSFVRYLRQNDIRRRFFASIVRMHGVN